MNYWAVLTGMILAVAWGQLSGPETTVLAADTPWRYYESPDRAADRPAPRSPMDSGSWHESLRRPTDQPQYHERNANGYPVHQDPLFDHGVRPDWRQEQLPPRPYERPAYDKPESHDLPIYRQEPWKAPEYRAPLYVKPDDSRPRYTIDNVRPPAYMKPTMVRPDDRPPNYVIHPFVKPAYDRSAYDRPHYDRPEYKPPVYVPDEFRPPRELPPPYIAPPR